MKCFLFIYIFCALFGIDGIFAHVEEDINPVSLEVDSDKSNEIEEESETDESEDPNVPVPEPDTTDFDPEEDNPEDEDQTLQLPSHKKDALANKQLQETIKRFKSEMEAGDPADLLSNTHVEQSNKYNDFGRRFVPQYQYSEVVKEKENADFDPSEPIPVKAPAELVLVVAKESALMGPDESAGQAISEIDRKKILRSGDYWNGVWKEEVNPAKLKQVLRSGPNPTLSTITAKIKPGTELYNIVSKMKKMSPRLLYIINKKAK